MVGGDVAVRTYTVLDEWSMHR